MKNKHTAAKAAPILRPLACGVLLALTGFAPTGLTARELDGVNEDIYYGDEPDMWELRNGAHLSVHNGHTLGITMDDSSVTLFGGTVARNSAFDTVSILLTGDSLLDAFNSRISDGGIAVRGSSMVNLSGSRIVIDESAQGFASLDTVGIAITQGDRATVWLLDSSITVVDNPAKEHFYSGVGIRQQAGKVTLTGNSFIHAANVGVVLHATRYLNNAIELEIDGSHVQSGRGAAIEVAPGADTNTYIIKVSNGSTLFGGDGNVLLVSNQGDAAPPAGQSRVNFVVDRTDLTGNITVDDSAADANVHVYLEHGAHLTGRMHQVDYARLNEGTWTLTGDSVVSNLTLTDGSQVQLGDGGTFNTLSVDSFSSFDSTLVFNTVLEGDDARTDRLVIAGDADGHAQVVVRNAGGQGAQTLQGIELITIGGDSGAEFTLLGRAVGGRYEYFLVKDFNGNWYLRSQLEEQPETPHECVQNPQLPQCEITLPVEPIDPEDPDTENPDPDLENPDPENPDPENPGIPQPVLRPETGAYLANQHATGTLLQHRARERMIAAEAVDGLRTWATTGHSEQRMHASGQQTLRSRQQRLQAGADIGAFDRGLGRVGAMFTAGRADSTARSTVTGYAAQGRVEGGALGVYAHWAGEALYLDASVQRGHFRNRVQGEGIAMERYDTQLWQGALEAGYRFRAGRIGHSTWHLQPQVQITQTRAAMGAHVEDNGTVVEQIADSSLSTRLGLRLEGDVATVRAHLKPYVEFNALHRGTSGGLRFDGEALDAVGPQMWTTLAVGGQAQFGGGLAAWGEIDLGRGGEGYRELGASVGVSYRW